MGAIMKKEYEGVKYEPTYHDYKNNLNKKQKEEDKNKNRFLDKYKYIILLVGLVVVSIGIVVVTFQKAYQKNAKSNNQNSEITENVKEQNNTKTQGVIKSIDELKSTVTFYDIKEGIDYTVNYDQATYIYDKYDKALVIKQIEVGEITDIYYDNNTNRLDKLKISSDAWEYKGVKNLVINQSKKEMSISNTTYQYEETLVIANEENLVNLMDLNEKDELIVKGYGKDIYSIIVDKGHGYIKVINYEDFVGGTVEVGYDIIMPIVEDMLIVATEGDYKFTMSNGDFVGTKTISVLRDKEITVDMGDFIKPATQNAGVEFKISPYGADLYIDGELTEYDEDVKLDYGDYDIEVQLSGYNTYTGELTVDAPSMTISIDLVQASEESEDTEEEADTSEDSSTTTNSDSTLDNSDSTTNTDSTEEDTNTNSTEEDANTDDSSTNTSSNSNNANASEDKEHTITVQGPAGSEVYLDGTLKGTAPVTFVKAIGTHTITLRKTGYSNKSYTIVVLDDSENVSFSFPELTLTSQ
jgi:cytoskeletal protein RodZ